MPRSTWLWMCCTKVNACEYSTLRTSISPSWVQVLGSQRFDLTEGWSYATPVIGLHNVSMGQVATCTWAESNDKVVGVILWSLPGKEEMTCTGYFLFEIFGCPDFPPIWGRWGVVPRLQTKSGSNRGIGEQVIVCFVNRPYLCTYKIQVSRFLITKKLSALKQ